MLVSGWSIRRVTEERLGERDVVAEDEFDTVDYAVDCCVVPSEGEPNGRGVERDYYLYDHSIESGVRRVLILER